MNNYVGQKREGIMVIILSIVTCGIYQLYWYYTIMEDINRATGEERMNSVGFLLGCIFCPPIAWYMLYKMDENLLRLSQEHGTFYKENFILWLLLTFVVGIGIFVAMFQICNALNAIWDARSGSGTNPQNPQNYQQY